MVIHLGFQIALYKRPCSFSKHENFSPKLAVLSHGGVREAYHRRGPQYLSDPKRTPNTDLFLFSISSLFGKENYFLGFNIFFILLIFLRGKHSQAKKRENINNYNLKSKRVSNDVGIQSCLHPTCAQRSCSHEMGS